MTQSIYQIETQLLPISSDTFTGLLSAKAIGSFEKSDIRCIEYSDTYWDTPNGDLHASALSLRTRARQGDDEFLDFKSPSIRLLGNIYGREFSTEKIQGRSSAIASLKLERPSPTIQALYRSRNDLLGMPLSAVLTYKVERSNFDISDKARQNMLTISAHRYSCQLANQEISGEVIEVQPKGARYPIDEYAKLASEVIHALLSTGWNISPIGKYSRTPRSWVELALRR